jgi:hypothetical protein
VNTDYLSVVNLSVLFPDRFYSRRPKYLSTNSLISSLIDFGFLFEDTIIKLTPRTPLHLTILTCRR